MNYEEFVKALDILKRKTGGGHEVEFKQLIIARKDLNMSPGKLAAQVAHASMAFLMSAIRKNSRKTFYDSPPLWNPLPHQYETNLCFGQGIFENWINGSFTKIVCKAKNKNDLLKAVKIANNMGLKEGIDFFLIKDNCLTELKPEEDGKTLTCIGFKPLSKEKAEKISKHFQLYK